MCHCPHTQKKKKKKEETLYVTLLNHTFMINHKCMLNVKKKKLYI